MNNYSEIKHLFNADFAQFESIDGILWAYSDADEKKLEWSQKTASYFQFEENQLKILQNKLNNNQFHGLTKIRIQTYIKDKSSHLKYMRKILSSFINTNSNIALTDRQNILTYQDLIFRDWCWSSKEIETYLDYIKNNLTGKEKNILVLGAGSCGLSYKLAQIAKANIIATDINPYLFLTAKNITSNKHTKLYEFTPFAKDLSSTSTKWEIKPQSKLENHYQVFTDFKDMPFKEKSFDLVIGCWFYDIIDLELETALKHANYFLKNEGQSIFIGPSNFHHKNISSQLTKDEIIATFENFFDFSQSEVKTMEYLENPKSSFKRLEDILFISANAPKILEKLEVDSSLSSFEFSNELMQYKQKNEIFYRILKHIDKSMTFDELSKKLEVEFSFSVEESKFYAENFMKKLFLEI